MASHRISTLGILALIAVLFCASLGTALARPMPPGMITAPLVSVGDPQAPMPLKEETLALTPVTEVTVVATTQPRATATPTTSPTATATAPATQTPPTAPSATIPPTATATVLPAEPSCVDHVFPIAVNQLALQANLPYWNRPLPMADPSAPAASIPRENRFRVYRQPSADTPATFAWGRWNGAEATGTSLDLSTALSGTGSLAAGFSELPPPASDPDALPLVNGVLEPGDWLAGTGATVTTAETRAALNQHIANKTMMILPVYDTAVVNGGPAESGYRIVRFALVRLLAYQFTPSNTSYLELALVADPHSCHLD